MISKKHDFMGMYEYSVLKAIQILGDQAYGAEIERFLSSRMNRKRVVGQVYMALTRLINSNFISYKIVKPDTPQRGGRSRHVFSLRPAGTKAVNKMNEFFEALR